MASKAAAAAETAETREDVAEAPLLDTIAIAIKKMVARGKERGYLTYDELNAALPQDQVTSEQIEDTMTMLSELGINVVEGEESEDPAEAEREAEDGESEARGNVDDDIGRTDDPVRMYLREMGSVELLSREGEIAIAKRIEAGREMMIGGICESPLTVRAMVGWRDALNENKMLLRDIIDLDATYGAANLDEAGAAIIKAAEAVGAPVAAMEAQLRPGMMAIFDSIADRHKKLAKIQDQRIAAIVKGTQLPRATERRYDKLKDEVVEALGKVKFNNTRIEHLVEQLYELNRRLVAEEGRLLRLAETAGGKRARLLQHYMGDELSGDWLETGGQLP